MLFCNRKTIVFMVWLFIILLQDILASEARDRPPFRNERCFYNYSIYPKDSDEKLKSMYRDISDAKGDRRYKITVCDADTVEPIPQYIVNAYILRTEIHQLRNGEDVESRSVIGYLESKRVNNPEGICVYENIPEGEYDFEIWADGYVLYDHRVKISKNIETGEITLFPGGRIKGCIIDAVTGEPLPNMKLQLSYSVYTKHGNRTYVRETDENGEFVFDELPDDSYKIHFPDELYSLNKLECVIQEVINTTPCPEELRTKSDEMYSDLLEKSTTQRYYIPPQLEVIDLINAQAHDCGIIYVESAPVLELEIVNEKNEPMINFPFLLEFADADIESTEQHFKTDSDGKRTIPLIGFMKDSPLVICIPEYPPVNPGKVFEDEEGDENLDSVQYTRMSTQERYFYSSSDLKENEQKRKEYLNERKLHITQWGERISDLNTKVIFPQPGEKIQLCMVYHPQETSLDLTFRVRDKNTQLPISQFKGIIDMAGHYKNHYIKKGPTSWWGKNVEGLGTNLYVFESVDETGTITFPFLPLPSALLKMEKDERIAPTENTYSPWQQKKDPGFYVVILAENYVCQCFKIPLSKARHDTIYTFDLEPEAIATGRILLADTGDPITPDTIKKALIKSGRFKTEEEIVRRLSDLSHKAPVQVNLQEIPVDTHIINFAFFMHILGNLSVTPDQHGRFTIDNLFPRDDYTLTIQAIMLPVYTQEGISLKAGMNDLGDIFLSFSEYLAGIVQDEKGMPIPDVYLQFPLQERYTYALQDIKSDVSGKYIIDLTGVNRGEQLFRISPPWGYYQDESRYENHEFLWYDLIKRVDHASGEQFHPMLHHGNTLFIEIPPTTASLGLSHYYYEEKYMSLPQEEKSKATPCFYLHNIALLSLEPTAESLVYHHTHPLPLKPVFTTETLRIAIPHVPPGPLGLRIDGEFYFQYNSSRPADSESEFMSHTLFPIIYTEFTMPATSFTLTTKVNSVDLKVELVNRPPEYGNGKSAQITLFLDRVEPFSTGLGQEYQRIIIQNIWRGVDNVKSLLVPFVGYCEQFLTPFCVNGSYHYSPVMLKSVPPGRYILKAFNGPEPFPHAETDFYYVEEITVPEGKKELQIKIPYKIPVRNSDIDISKFFADLF